MASTSTWLAGTARRIITPSHGVELAGLGYYLNRTWERVRDDLTATALVITDASGDGVAIVALDLMYNSTALTGSIREQVATATDLRPDHICVNVSHTHNAPTAGLIRGAGDVSHPYVEFVAQQAASAAIEAWQTRRPARLFVGSDDLPGMTFNRARENGPVDACVGVLRADDANGAPLAVVVNFHSHCIAHMETDLRAVSRDWPGEVVDQIEATLPGATAMYLQGAAGDVNFLRKYNGTELRHEPAKALTRVALAAHRNARPIEPSSISAVTHTVALPTRRWTRDEVLRERDEAIRRQTTGDTTGWTEGIGRIVVNLPERLPLRYSGSVEKAVAAVARFMIEWSDETLPDLGIRPESLDAEVQAIRIGDIWIVTAPGELFTSLGLMVRSTWPHDDLFILGYSNGSIGYIPDAKEVDRQTYASIQSARFTGQLPFTPQAGATLVGGMLKALRATAWKTKRRKARAKERD